MYPINYSDDLGMNETSEHPASTGHTVHQPPASETNGSFKERLLHLPSLLHGDVCVHSCVSHLEVTLSHSCCSFYVDGKTICLFHAVLSVCLFVFVSILLTLSHFPSLFFFNL